MSSKVLGIPKPQDPFDAQYHVQHLESRIEGKFPSFLKLFEIYGSDATTLAVLRPYLLTREKT